MEKMPDESVDLIVTDPPYLINYRSNRRVVKEKFDRIQNDKDANQLISKSLYQYHRILKNDSAIYMFCSWHHIEFFKTEFEKYFTLKNILIWNKNNHGSGDLKGAYAPKYEMVLFGHKGRSLFQEKRIADVIDCAKVSSAKLVHPTEKPTELLELFIRNNSRPNDIVFDGFIGAGSTALAALHTGRRFIGYELDGQYYQTACQRIDDFER
jgi:site-specific DNA-methyltransferase (adenine-specific)